MDAIVLGKKELNDFVRGLLRNQRQDIRKKICSLKDVLYVLDMSERAFFDHIKTADCLIQRSTKKGKYVLESVYAEADRLNFIKK